MKILVTGGEGFIGKAVIKKLLERDIESIVSFDNLSPKIHGTSACPHDFGDKRVQFIKGDVSRRENIEPVLLSSDVIVHLAAETGTGQSMYDIEHYSNINISAMSLILDLLTNKKHHVKKIILASSRAVYSEGKYSCPEHGIVYPGGRLNSDMANGDFEVKCPYCSKTPKVMATSEDSLLHPISFYGITKQVQESILMTLCRNIDIAAVTFRYQNVYGPGQSLKNPYTGILSIFSNLILSENNIDVYEDGMESRDFIYIDDVADVTVESVFSDCANGEILNIGSGLPVSVLEVAQKLKQRFSSGIDIRINGKYRMGDIRHNYADLTKTKSVLGFTPKVMFDEGLDMFVDWVKQQPPSPDLYRKSIAELYAKGMYK